MPVSGLSPRSSARVSGGESTSAPPRTTPAPTTSCVSGGESAAPTRPFTVPVSITPMAAASTFWAGLWNVATLPWQMLSMFMPRAPTAPAAPATPPRVSGGESSTSRPAAPARPATPARVSGGEASSPRVSGGE